MEELMLAAAERGDTAALSNLLDDGCDVAYQNPSTGLSALMHACDNGHVEAVEMLLRAGCPWNLQDKDGYTAGEYAMHCPVILEMLLDWGVQAELILGSADSHQTSSSTMSSTDDNEAYLSQRLHYTEDGTKLLDADGEAVMMGWEGPLMIEHAKIITHQGLKGKRVMNVGFGLGLIDAALQEHQPSLHIIIEGHPDVYAQALKLGWGQKPSVRLLFGKWQNVIPALIQEGLKLDGIFWDTYAEYYKDMREFHDTLPLLLTPGGIYSYFNGLAPDNIFFHMVYGRLISLEMAKLGFTTSFQPFNVKSALDPQVWEGVKNKYWHFEKYFLPTCTFKVKDDD
jgi:protein arginine N-methyltransferase 2